MGGLTKQNEEKKEKIVRIEKAVEELPKQYEDKLSRGRIMSTEYEPITGNVNKRRNVMKDSSPTILGKTGRSKCMRGAAVMRSLGGGMWSSRM